MAPLLEEPDRTDERADDFLRGVFAGVVLTLLAIAVVAGTIVAGLR